MTIIKEAERAKRFLEIKKLFHKQLLWYAVHKDDQDYVYDCAYEEFSGEGRSIFSDFLKILDE